MRKEYLGGTYLWGTVPGGAPLGALFLEEEYPAGPHVGPGGSLYPAGSPADPDLEEEYPVGAVLRKKYLGGMRPLRKEYLGGGRLPGEHTVRLQRKSTRQATPEYPGSGPSGEKYPALPP